MFVTALAFSFTIAIIDHFIHREEAIKHYEEKIDFIEETITESLQTIDKAHNAFGCSTDKKMRESTDYLLKLYEGNSDLDTWDFDELYEKLDLDIYMINQDNVITHTTFKKYLHLDFNEYCSTLSRILDNRRKMGDFFIDYIDVEQMTGETKKYSYQATPDKKYIIQLSIPIEESSVFEHFSFFPTIEELKEKHSMVEDINVLNIGGHAIGKTDYPSTMTPKRYDAFLQARDLSERAEIKDKHHDKGFIYRYVYYEPIDISQNAEQRVLEIIYNEDELNKTLANNTKRLIYQLLVVLVIILVTIFGIQKWISRQIYLARHDNLTELKKRRAFEEIFRKEIQKRKGLTALIMIDLDNFKSVNDTYGHLRGDGVLKLVANTLRKTIEEPHEVFRIGGDEFAVILGETDKPFIKETVQKLENNISEAIAKEKDLEGFNIQASIGLSIAPLDGIYLETLFEKADVAMYDAKEKQKKYESYLDFRH